MLGIPIALAVFGYGEWATHKYLLHGLGRDRKSKFSFHYHEHHQAVRRNGGYDPAYEGPVWSTTTQAREAIGLAAVALAHAPPRASRSRVGARSSVVALRPSHGRSGHELRRGVVVVRFRRRHARDLR